MALFCTTIRRYLISLLRHLFLRHFQVFSCEISLSLTPEMSLQLFFFPFLFSGSFCSLDACIVCIVPGGWNQSSSALFFYVVLESFYRFIVAILNAGKSSSSFFSWHIQSVYVIHGIVLWSICLSSFVYFKTGPEYITREQLRRLSLWWYFCYIVLVSSSFLVLFLNFFFHLHLFNGVRFQYSQILVGFHSNEHTDFFLIW